MYNNKKKKNRSLWMISYTRHACTGGMRHTFPQSSIGLASVVCGQNDI